MQQWQCLQAVFPCSAANGGAKMQARRGGLSKVWITMLNGPTSVGHVHAACAIDPKPSTHATAVARDIFFFSSSYSAMAAWISGTLEAPPWPVSCGAGKDTSVGMGMGMTP